MSAVEASVSSSSSSIKYQYNKMGTVRAPIQAGGAVEVLLDVKLVQQVYATAEALANLGKQPGPAGEARSAGFDLSYQPATVLGIETLNELNGQWRPVPSSSIFAVVASLPE